MHYPFGHGLGYATFELEVLEVTAGDVTAVLKHVAGPGGSAVVQVYGSEPSRLLAFEKRFLDEGDEDVVSLRFHGSVSEVAVGFSSGEATTYAVQGGAGDGFRRDLNWWILVVGPPYFGVFYHWLASFPRPEAAPRGRADAVERAPPLARADGDVPARRLRRGRRVLLDTAGRGEAAVCLTLAPVGLAVFRGRRPRAPALSWLFVRQGFSLLPWHSARDIGAPPRWTRQLPLSSRRTVVLTRCSFVNIAH